MVPRVSTGIALNQQSVRKPSDDQGELLNTLGLTEFRFSKVLRLISKYGKCSLASNDDQDSTCS